MTLKTPPRSHPSDRGPDTSESDGCNAGARRVYHPPRLEVLGDIRALTLGATPGVGDSTPPNTQPF